jgi:hypothetical protein
MTSTSHRWTTRELAEAYARSYATGESPVVIRRDRRGYPTAYIPVRFANMVDFVDQQIRLVEDPAVTRFGCEGPRDAAILFFDQGTRTETLQLLQEWRCRIQPMQEKLDAEEG